MRVVMLVSNPCVNDARVIREAAAVAAAGHEVLVLAHAKVELPEAETRDGFSLRRVNVMLRDLTPPDVKAAQLAAVQKRGIPWTELPLTEAASRFVKTRSKHYYRVAKVRSRRAATALTKKTITPTGFLAYRHVTGFTGPACAWKPDVVHAHDLYTLPAGHQIAKRTGARLIYDSHELELGRNGRFSKREIWLKRQLEGKAITMADAVVTVCDSIADHLRDFYKIKRPVVVHNSPEMDRRTPSAGDIRSVLGLGEGVPIAIYVGSVTFNRGVEIGVDAIAKLAGVHYAMIGPRNAGTEAETRARAKALGVEGRVHFVDPVPHNEVVSFVRSADVSLVLIQDVCLSYRYCFPNKLLESLLAGVPVVASDLVELRRMVELTGCGSIVDQTDPDAIAEGIREVLANRARYLPNEETRAILRQTYSWEQQSQKLSDLYKSLERPA